MKQGLREAITKTVHDSSFLHGDLREAHQSACEDNPILAILLRDLIGEAVKIKDRLGEIKSCLGGDE